MKKATKRILKTNVNNSNNKCDNTENTDRAGQHLF